MIIEGENVRLRPATSDDLPAYTRWYTDPEFRRYLGSGDEVLQGLLSPSADSVKFSVEVKDGTLIGVLFIGSIRTVNRNCELVTIGIGEPAYRDRGFGTEMVALVLDFCFNQMNMHQVHVRTAEFNERARACYSKLFPHEQVNREWVWLGDRFWDQIYFDITEDEWATRNA